jgi:hypothetical protein
MALAATPARSELPQPGAEGGDEDKSGKALAWVLLSSIVITPRGGQAPGPGHRIESTMPHDKIRAASRKRMAQTGEPYAAARRAVVREHQDGNGEIPSPGAGYALRMSGEIHDWLAGLRDGNPVAAIAVGQALAALLNEGARLREPLVASTADSWVSALATGLDRSYQKKLERLTAMRRGEADAASLVEDIRKHAVDLESAQEKLRDRHHRLLDADTQEAARAAGALAAAQRQATQVRQLLPKVIEAGRRLGEETQRLQARADAFRAQKEVLKASYTSAHVSLLLHESMTATGQAGSSGDREEEEGAEAIRTAEARLLRDATFQMEGELGQKAWPQGLMELRPARPDDVSIRILFAVEPVGTVLLIAVLDGSEAVRDHYLEAILLSADMLRQVRAGRAPEAIAHAYDNTRCFLEEFYPGES